MPVDILRTDGLEDVRTWLSTLPREQHVGDPGNHVGCLVHAYGVYRLTGNPDPQAAYHDSAIQCYQDDYYVSEGTGKQANFSLNRELAYLSWSFDNIDRHYDHPEDDRYAAVTVGDALELVDTLITSREDWLVKDEVEPD